MTSDVIARNRTPGPCDHHSTRSVPNGAFNDSMTLHVHQKMVNFGHRSPLDYPRGSMVNEADPHTIAFGRTRIVSQLGETFDQTVQSIMCPANTRGILPSSGAHSLRSVAGPEIERATMGMAPLQLGSAVLTGGGKLQERGIDAIVHAVVSVEPGGARSLPVVRRAIASGLEVAYRERISSIAVPLMTGSHLDTTEELHQWIEAVVEEAVSHVRRDRVRLETIVLVSRYPDDIEFLNEALTTARSAAWPA